MLLRWLCGFISTLARLDRGAGSLACGCIAPRHRNPPPAPLSSPTYRRSFRIRTPHSSEIDSFF